MCSIHKNLLKILLLVGAIGISMVLFGSQAQQPAQLTPQQFQASPTQVLANFASGGPVQISLIRQIATADDADLPLFMHLLATASPDETKAIGGGLGQAALASVTTDRTY